MYSHNTENFYQEDMGRQFYSPQNFKTDIQDNIRNYTITAFNPNSKKNIGKQRDIDKIESYANNTDQFPQKQKHDLHCISQSRPTQNVLNQESNKIPKATSLRQFHNEENQKFELATFSNKIGSHNSFLSVIIHLIYKIKILRNFILSGINDIEIKNNKFLQYLKAVIIKYPENKKINISKMRIALSQVFKNSNSKNKFDFESPNDPCEFLFAFVNMIHSLYNNKPISEVYQIENCACLAHNYIYLNIIKHDECECCAINRSSCSLHNCIIDIPIESVLKMSNNHSGNLFYSKEKLLSYYKNLVQFQRNIQCPLNGEDCNYNRMKRTLILSNKHSLPNFLTFALIKKNSDTNNSNNNNNGISLIDILHTLLLIPNNFDIDYLFTISNSFQNTQYEFFGCVFSKVSKTFTCGFKCCSEKNSLNQIKWIYYDDENVMSFSGWNDLISHCLKNAITPYMLFYKIKNEENEEMNNSENDLNINNNTINKNEFKILENYALEIDNFENSHARNYARVSEELIISNEENMQKSKPRPNEIEIADYTPKSYLNTNNNEYKEGTSNSIAHSNPYKREKKKKKTESLAEKCKVYYNI